MRRATSTYALQNAGCGRRGGPRDRIDAAARRGTTETATAAREAERVVHAPTFSELVYAHFDWWRGLHDGRRDETAKARYHEALTTFEARHGEIVSAYWCTQVESAVALTEKKRALPWATPAAEFHRESDWATQDSPDIACELHRCDELAVRARRC